MGVCNNIERKKFEKIVIGGSSINNSSLNNTPIKIKDDLNSKKKK